ncbi:MAG: M28 family metallopeptidase [Alphaproteobacteria bacterium]
MKLTAISAMSAAIVALAACSPKPAEAPKAAEPAAPAAAAAPVGAVLTTTPDINAADLAARDKELADDKYEGRGPGTITGEAAGQWIADEMKRIGLEPAVNGSYFQDVDVVAQTVTPEKSSFAIADAKGKTIDFAWSKDVVYATKHQKVDNVSFKDTDVVFVGYGVNAPEEHWNDFAGVDVKGKTIVMFVNDPGFVTHDPKIFKGKAMTYYGRWTYKYEEAGRQGAAAAIIIHETEPAAYGWNVVQSSWTGEQSDLVRTDGGDSTPLMEGWITLDKAKEVFAAAGLDIDKMRAAANKPGFKAVPMTGLKASGEITQTITHRKSRNVAGTIKGTEHPDEHYLFTAHWDHLGKDPKAPPGTDGIHNGAVDNGTGVATILEIAEKMAHDPKPKRSVTFLSVTLEESGLLGSAYFAEHPFIPLNKIVAGLNVDALTPGGAAKDMVVVGSGAQEQEDMLKAILAKDKRTMSPDPAPEKGGFFRSDHISLAKKGVPMLDLGSGENLVNGGPKAGRKQSEDYTEHRYHQVSDEFDPNWDWSGIVQDAKVMTELAEEIANSDKWPGWHKTSEFKAARDASLKDGK